MPILVSGVQAVRGEDTQALAIGATATTIGPFESQWVEITADIAANFAIGTSPVAATATSSKLPRDTILYRKITPGDSLSFITTTGTATGVLGTAWVTEVIE